MDVTVLGINDIGQAVGFVRDCMDPHTRLPFVWTPEHGCRVLDMPTGFIDGEGRAINNMVGSQGHGQIICRLRHFTSPLDTAFFYDDGQWRWIPPTEGIYSSARGINDDGEVSGSRMTSNGLCGFRWHDGHFTNILADSPGSFALGNGMNAFGEVAGELIGPEHAFWWDGENLHDLGAVLSGPSAFAVDINNHGDMTGGARILDRRQRNSRLHAFVHDGVTGNDLTIPRGFDASFGIAINDARQVIVRASDFDPPFDVRSYLWQNDSLTPIDELVSDPGDVTVGHHAEAINEHGHIATSGEWCGAAVGLILAPAALPAADVNFDCAVDQFDIMAILQSWGPCPPVGSCLADVVSLHTFQPPADGRVDGADLAYILGNWAPTCTTNE
jgi:uncharacterized membrane protein